MGKHKLFKFMGFLNILGEAEIHAESGIPKYEKSMGKHKYSKVMGFSNILGEAEIHKIPKTLEKWISIVQEKYGVSQIFRVKQKSIKIPKYRKSNSCSKTKIWENTNISKLRVS